MGLNPAFARPEWMVITRLAVPPPAVRPSIMTDTISRREDDLTCKLAEIVKYNTLLKNQEFNGAPSPILSEFTAILQFHIATYFNNEIPGQPQVSIHLSISYIYLFYHPSLSIYIYLFVHIT